MTGTRSERECDANRKKDFSRFILHFVFGSGRMRHNGAKGSHGSYYHNTASQPLGDRWKASYLHSDSVRGSNVDLSMEEKRNIGKRRNLGQLHDSGNHGLRQGHTVHGGGQEQRRKCHQ